MKPEPDREMPGVPVMSAPQGRRPTTSQARIDANRRNSRLCTGPCTDAGKSISKYNGVTHGLTAQGIIPGENPAELEARIEKWCREMDARTAVECALVEAAATAHWRIQRARRIEDAAISQQANALVDGYENDD